MFSFKAAKSAFGHHHIHRDTGNLVEDHLKFSNYDKGQILDEKPNALLSKKFLRHSIINGAGILHILGGRKIFS